MNNEYNGYEVAVIGMSARLPKSGNIKEYWDNLVNGRDCVTHFSDDDLSASGISDDDLKKPDYIKANGILDDYEYFDAPFFNYTHNEAELMDPQKRIFLQLLWHALEDAGYDPFTGKEVIGVYAGFGKTFDWEVKCMLKGYGNIDPFTAEHLTSSLFTPTQASYKLNLKGPSYFAYSACSTSLLAIHNAVQAILSGECDIALAGGLTVNTNQKTGYLYDPEMIFSPDGLCRPFDSEPSGVVGGNGGGVVALKLLEDAIRDKDNIYAVIKGSAINNDGDRKVGYTAPSIDGQVEVVRSAVQAADVSPESIGFIETHGTATRLGDPIEFKALNKAFDTSEKNFCALGAVKSNIGHCDAGAGVAGFIKTVLCLKHKKLVPTLHFRNPNPSLGIENSPFYINTEYRDFVSGTGLLRAGVSSLGIGGTNAHVVLENYPDMKIKPREDKEELIVLSAKTKKSLDSSIDELSLFLKDNKDADINEMSYTLQNGRHHFSCRAMFTARSAEECIEKLDCKTGISRSIVKRPVSTKIFMFSGQGSQYVGMGKELYEKEQVFKENIDRCFIILKSILNEDLRDILYPADSSKVEENEIKLNQMKYSGPIKFSFEYALSVLMIHYGIEPDMFIGHSFGEYVAATLCGVFSLEDALRMSVIRGKLMHRSADGAMMSVSLSEEELSPYLNDKVSLAAVNTQSMCIVSGEHGSLDELFNDLTGREIECLKLNVPRGGHSYLMDGILDEFKNEMNNVKFGELKGTYYSGMLGRKVSSSEICNPGYWTDHIRNTVRFSDTVSAIMKENADAVFIEVSPGRGLSLFVETNLNKENGHRITALVRHRKDMTGDTRYFLEKLGYLWLEGCDIRWDKLHKERPCRISLPGYSFDKYLFKCEGNLMKEIEGLYSRFGNMNLAEEIAYVPSETEPREEIIEENLFPRPAAVTSVYIQPRTDLEKDIQKIFTDFFRIREIGIDDNFFELGGDSLKAMKLANIILKRTGIKLTVAKFLKYPSIRILAEYIGGMEGGQGTDKKETGGNGDSRERIRI